MTATVGRMTRHELRAMIEIVIEEKLVELLGDPDEGLTLRPSLRERLRRQQRAVAHGERGRPLAAVMAELERE